MEIKNKLYSYPVLTSFSDDYVNSKFNINLNAILGKNHYNFIFDAELSNDETIIKLIDSRQASFIVHIECSNSCFRERIISFDKHFEYVIDANRVNGSIEVCSFIIAQEDIDEYMNPNFNKVYGGVSFDIEKYSIMAIGCSWKIPIVKEYDEIKQVSSIFSLVANFNIDSTSILHDSNGHRIVIKIPKKQFDQVKNLSHLKTFHRFLHSTVILPVLMMVLEDLKHGDWEDYSNLRWFRGIMKALERQKIPRDQSELQSMQMMTIAQKLLDDPITQSIAELDSFINSDTD
jgi:hypothetical protein